MGLDISHDAFSGAYSAFNRFRNAVCEAMGGKWATYDDGMWYWGDDYGKDTHPGLYALLMHSDCDGEIAPDMAASLADELESLLPRMNMQGSGGGHIEREGGYGAVTSRLIAGCRYAASSNEPLEFR